MGRFAHFYKALKFKTCRTLLSNVWNKELTLIQRRILGTLRNEKRVDTQVSRKQNSIPYIKLQTARKLNLFYRNMRSTEWKKGRSQRYIPFLLHLETRLDVLLVRIHFCENLVQARQLISHGKVCVNHAITNKIHWKVSPGSVISWKEDAGITRQTELNVKTVTGKTITVEANSSDSVNDVKEKIAAKEGIPTNLQQLVYAGHRLEDGQVMASYAFEKEALNVVDFGAKADGSRDSMDAFLKTWNAACASTQPTSIVVPGGEFLIGEILFAGPCRNKNIQFQIEGSIVAPMDDSSFLNANAWITFESVDGLDINGGIINGRGNSIWACKNANHNSNNCQQGPRNLLFFKGNNINIKGLTTIDSNQFHIVIDSCTNVNVAGVHVIAPETSPNTDGIHVGKSTTVNITDCNIKTGDDCISIGPGTSGLFVGNCNCGPGHGISIGSLGSGEDDEKNDVVENITVEGAVFTGTQNGVRIKTWGKPTTGNVNGVVFHHIIMQDVENPIIIDQEYCPAGNCNNQPSRIKIHDITFSDIRGTSSSLIAINFVCSSSTPCQDIKLIDVKLNPGKDVNGQALQSSCKNAQGSTSGDVAPASCF